MYDVRTHVGLKSDKYQFVVNIWPSFSLLLRKPRQQLSDLLLSLDWRNRAIVVAESLARVIAAIRITVTVTVLVGGRIPPKTYAHRPQESNSAEMFRRYGRKLRWKLGEIVRRFSAFNFQEKWPQQTPQKKKQRTFHEAWSKILSLLDSGGGGSQKKHKNRFS